MREASVGQHDCEGVHANCRMGFDDDEFVSDLESSRSSLPDSESDEDGDGSQHSKTHDNCIGGLMDDHLDNQLNLLNEASVEDKAGAPYTQILEFLSLAIDFGVTTLGYIDKSCNLRVTALLDRVGYTPEISHGMLVEMAEHRKELEKKKQSPSLIL
ncbi:hypothetical protein L1049_017175 [Liquidambar formosana]|uniref:Uncharacterized protein n=1 Tax=Liquidambar formosana TaxID=63359 RepID=A0AAP0X3Z2_LIQFO